MRSWRSRLSMVLTTLAVVLVVSVPAMAEDIEVECEVDDGVCKETLSYSSDQYEDDGSELQGDAVDDPVDDCFPFCGLDWWPW